MKMLFTSLAVVLVVVEVYYYSGRRCRVEVSALRLFFVFFFVFCRCRSWSAHALLSMRGQFAPCARNKIPDKKTSLLVAYHTCNLDFILSLIQLEWVKSYPTCNSCQQNNHKF